MKKMFFLLSVAFLLVAATPAWPANNNGPMSEQKWPETVQAWPDADDMVACVFSFPICAWPSPSGYPFPANIGYPYTVSKVA